MRQAIVLAGLCIMVPARAQAAPTVHADPEHGFRIEVPSGCGEAPLAGRMVWHTASEQGTQRPDCSVIVTKDWAFGVLTVDQYIASQNEANAKKALALAFEDVKIAFWEPKFRLGGQRALHFVYAGILNGVRQTSITIQTIRSGRLYTFSCNAESSEFFFRYKDLLDIADSFAFIPISE